MELTALSGNWRQEFTRAAETRREDILAAQARVNQLWRDDQKKEQTEELKARDDLVATEIILASTRQIADFEIKLDTYDQATVQSLMRNGEQLEAVQERLSQYLEQAYVLPDGRRVFRTKDGKQVFDEHGKEVKPEEIDPKDIDEKHPFWDSVKKDIELKAKFEEQRRELLEYQDKLDESRDRIRSGEPISEKDLKEMERDLGASMPDTIRQQLPSKDKTELDAKNPASGSVEISVADLDEISEFTSKTSEPAKIITTPRF